MVLIGGGSTKSVLSDRWIVYTKSRKQLLHRKYLLYDTGCISNVYVIRKKTGGDGHDHITLKITTEMVLTTSAKILTLSSFNILVSHKSLVWAF